MYGVIMAGGRGSRFWPRSRKRRSKQVLNIVGRNTMIQDTVYRLSPLISPRQVIIVTNHLLADEIRRQLPAVPPENVMVEPANLSTMPCVGLAAVYIRKHHREAVMAVFAADHVIQDVPTFHRALEFAEKLCVEHGALVTFGAKPTAPETGYGYLEMGEKIAGEEPLCARSVVRFNEKPDLETAERYVADGRHRYNTGMFVWTVEAILEEYEKLEPDAYRKLTRIEDAIGTPSEFKALGEVFPTLPNVSIDKAIMERSSRVIMVETDFGWNDMGSWTSLYNTWPKDDDGNAVVGQTLRLDTKNCLIYSPNRFVATLGIENVIIVETDDVVMVCGRDRAQDVSRFVEELRDRKLEEFL
ncbi:MAG: mannose-1-phosphate guanylyltransferase [bacterium]